MNSDENEIVPQNKHKKCEGDCFLTPIIFSISAPVVLFNWCIKVVTPKNDMCRDNHDITAVVEQKVNTEERKT